MWNYAAVCGCQGIGSCVCSRLVVPTAPSTAPDCRAEWCHGQYQLYCWIRHAATPQQFTFQVSANSMLLRSLGHIHQHSSILQSQRLPLRHSLPRLIATTLQGGPPGAQHLAQHISEYSLFSVLHTFQNYVGCRDGASQYRRRTISIATNVTLRSYLHGSFVMAMNIGGYCMQRDRQSTLPSPRLSFLASCGRRWLWLL